MALAGPYGMVPDLVGRLIDAEIVKFDLGKGDLVEQLEVSILRDQNVPGEVVGAGPVLEAAVLAGGFQVA